MQVSIVIPCHNAERFIGRCLDSCFAQTHRPIELIAVDDGSADGTAALLEQAAARAPFAMRVVKQSNAGACAARNAGLALATGAYIQFMDADDALHPTKIAAQVRIATDQGLPGIVAGSVRTIPPNGDEAQARIERVGHGDAWLDLMSHGLGQTSSNLWKRDDVEACHGWDPAMGSSQEYDLMFRILRITSKVIFDTENYSIVRKRSTGSITQTNLGPNWVRYVELRTRIIGHLKNTRSPAELAQFHQFLFDSIRVLYEHDPKSALAFHAKELPPGFSPSVSPTTRRAYLALYNVLGFRNTQWLWSRFHWLAS